MAEKATQKTIEPTVEEQIQTKVEELAKGIGWVPESEWRGRPGDHKPAEQYISDSKKVIKGDKQTMKSMENKIDTLNTQLGSIRKEHKEGVVRELNTIKQDLEDQRRKAAVDGDSDEYDKIQEKLTKIEKEVLDTTVAAAAATATSAEGETAKDVLFSNWQKANPWYEEDMAMTAHADDIANEISENTPMARRLEIIDAAVQARFPDAFEEEGVEAAAAAGASDAETGGAGGAGGDKLSYESLPVPGKAACDSFVEQGLGTKEEWMKSYIEAEAESPF